MSGRDELIASQRVLADALQRAAVDDAAPAGVPGVDADGLRLSARIAARLRFERLLHGSHAAAAWFDRDAADFTRTFRRYHAERPPRALGPRAEARDFDAWLTNRRSKPDARA